MAKFSSAGGRGLNLIAKLSVADAIKSAQALKKEMRDIAGSAGAGTAKAFDVKPLTEYQAGLLKIKQEALDLTKAKAEQAKADRTASLATQEALREESRIKREQIALQKQLTADANKKKPTQISNSQAEIDAYKKAQQGSMLYTAAINNEVVARAKLNAIAANAAVANGTLNAGINYNTQATQQQTTATNQNVLSKKQLAQMLAEEKLRQAESTKELKNNAREMLNAKGSIEQRKAALERLVTAYGRLSKAERESASGQRMNTIVKDLGAQINKLDPTKVEKVAKELKKVPESLPKSSDGNIFNQLFSSISGGALSTLGPIALMGAAWTAAKAIFSHNVEISDTFADVRRTAKLSTDEVGNLADGLKDLNTRTNLEGLLDIGFIGGRLGVVKKDLPEFIKQVDELAVVLKKELPGGAEAVAESLGRIVTIYKITQAEGVSLGTALSKVGSNMLELAHSGPVTVKYLQDFTLGVAGTAASAKLSIPVISAYGAVLGESGQIASSAALSVTRLVTGLTTKTGKYAAIAQLADSTLTVEKFTNIVNTDTKKALDLFFKGLKAGNPVATEFAARLGSVGITTGKVTNAVKILAENQDKLADRIVKGTHAFEEGTSVAHNFEIANDSLGASVDKLGNAVVNLTTNPNSNMFNFFKGLIDGATKSVGAIDILIATVKGITTDPKKFIADSAAKSRNEAQEKINADAKKIAEATYRNKDTSIDGERLSILKEEVKIRDILDVKYLKAKVLYESVKKSDRTLSATQELQEIDTQRRKQIALVKELNKLRNGGQKVDVIGTGELTDTDQGGRTIDDIKADIKRVTELKKPLDVASKQYKEYVRQLKEFKKELRDANGLPDTESAKADHTAESLIKARNTLQKEIDKMVAGSSRKQMTADDAEVSSISEKYDTLRQKAKEYYDELNKKIPKDKQTGFGLTLSKIDSSEVDEKQAAINKGINDRFRAQLEQQTRDFEAVEDYRLKYGADKAQERYTKEFNISVETYQKQFSSAEVYAKKLEDLQTDILNKYGDPTGYTESQKQELAIATENIVAFGMKRKDINDSFYADAYESAESLTDKLTSLDVKYAKRKMAIQDKEAENGPAKSLAMYKLLDEAYKVDADAFIDADNAKSKVFKRLAEDALVLTRSQITEQIKGLENAMKDIDIPNDLKDKIQKTIDGLKIRLNIGVDQSNLDTLRGRRLDVLNAIDLESKKATPSVTGLKEELADLNNEIDNLDPKGSGKASGLKSFLNSLKDNKALMGTATGLNLASDAAMTLSEGLGGVDTEAGYTLDTIGKLAGAAGDLVGAVASGDPAKIIGSAIKAVGTLFSIGKKVKEMNAAARKEVADYYSNAISGEREYQDLLKNRQIENVRNNKIALNGIRDEVALRTQQTAAYKTESDEIMAKLQGQSFVSSESYTHGTWFKKAKVNKKYESLQGKSFAELSSLLSQGKLEGDTKALVERLKELEQKGYDAEKAMAELAQQTSELFTGTTSDNLTNSLAEMFASGKTGALDLADFFKQSMDDAALNIFKNKVLAGKMEEFYKNFDKAAQSGDELTAAEIAQLQLDFSKMTDEALKKFEEYKKITGSDLKGSKDSTAQGASGKIVSEALTEGTANRGLGIWQAQYDIQKATSQNIALLYQTTLKQFDATVQIAANTLRTANNTDGLAGKLDKVIENTTPVKSTSFDQALRDAMIK